jgi:hypothetical protein
LGSLQDSGLQETACMQIAGNMCRSTRQAYCSTQLHLAKQHCLQGILSSMPADTTLYATMLLLLLLLVLLLLQDGYYGPGGSDADAIRGDSTQCIRCPTGRRFSFPSWNGRSAEFKPLATSSVGATSSSDCLAEYAQAVDGLFFLNLKPSHPDFVTVSGRESLGACTAYCSSQDSCAAVTFNYATVQCSVWRPSAGSGASFAANGGIALMTMLSSFDASNWGGAASRASAGSAAGRQPVTTQAAAAAFEVTESAAAAARAHLQLLQTKVRAAGMGSGYFTFWPNAAAAAALDSSRLESVDSATTLSGCLWACSTTNLCAGVVFGALDAATGGIGQISGTSSRCQRILGQAVVDPRRTLLRAKYTALSPAL